MNVIIAPVCPDCRAEVVDGELTHVSACSIQRWLDLVKQADLRWFRANPRERMRERPVAAAELADAWVTGLPVRSAATKPVTVLSDGQRISPVRYITNL